jgi:putative membrane protein
MSNDAPDGRRGPTLIDEAAEAQPSRRSPTLIEDVEALPEAPDATKAPDVDAPEAEATATGAAITLAGRGPSLLSRLFWSALISLLMMALGLWFWETVEALIALNVWLGRIALGLSVIVGVSLLAWSAKELAALSRLKRVDKLKEQAARARRSRDAAAARSSIAALHALYRGRPELTTARERVTAQAGETLDGDALIDLAERSYLTPLDDAAQASVRRGAKQVAAATALIPLALIDVLSALTVNVRMIREIVEIYGGRAGWLGSWRLLRAVAGHLIATGAVAVGDDLIGAALGGGVLSRVSRRFGEGLVNGALTARIGVAAIEVCRPLPFEACKKPSVGALIRGAFTDFRDPKG